MSDIALALLNRLTAVSGVTDLIGSRVYPEYNRQADRAYPLVVYKINVGNIEAFDGPTGVETAVIRLAFVATTYAAAVALGTTVKTALNGQSGTWAGLVVQGVFLQDDGITDDVVTDPSTEVILYYVKELVFDAIYNA